MTIKEIEARIAEIKSEVAEATEERMTELEAEMATLKEERKKAEELMTRRQKLTDEVNSQPETRNFGDEKEERTMPFERDTKEYRNAWLKSLAGMKMSETEQRAYASTDDNTAIPTIVADRMFEKMKKVAPMLSEITLMQVAGNLKFIAEGTRNSAAKHTENTSVTASADTIVSVTLGANEFFKIINISKNAANLSVDAFENWLVEMLAGDLARVIDDFILNDSTNGVAAITYSTNSTQIVNTGTYTYKNVTDLIALLPAAYDAEAKFLVNKATLWGKIAGITNTAGDPIFIPDTREGFTGRLLGYPVVLDDYVTTANNALYLGRWTDVVGNMSQPIEVEKNESAGFTSGTIVYRGYAAFDSKPAKTDGIVRLVSTTA